MSITVRVKMNQNVQKALKNSQGRALTLSGLEIERAMKIVLSGSGGQGHTPSLPGAPPNRQHGELRSSVQSALRADGNGVLAGATAQYAKYLEHGAHPTVTDKMRRWAWAMFRKTKNGLYKALALTRKDKLTIAPRPFIQRSLDAALPKIMRHWKGMLHR